MPVDNLTSLALLIIALALVLRPANASGEAAAKESAPLHEKILDKMTGAHRIKYIPKRERKDPRTEHLKAIDPHYEE